MWIKVHRSIVFVKPERSEGAPAYWVIHDVVSAREYQFQASSYLHAVRPFQIIRDGLARVEGKSSCLVAFAEAPSIRRFLTAVDYSTADAGGMNGGRYGRASQRHRLVATKWNDIGDNRPITFTMLLMPFKGAKPPNVSLRPVSAKADDGEHVAAFAVGIQGRKDTIAFNPGDSADFRVGQKKLVGPMAAKIDRRWIECPGCK